MHAFEPTPEVVERLWVNISLNSLANIAVNPVAVGQQPGKIFLHYSGGREGDNEGMNYVSLGATHSSDRMVPVVSLDDYCRQQGIIAIDLLKMDIEGHEYNALRGATGLLKRQAIHCILMELNSWAAERGGHTLAEVITLLRDNDYCFFVIQQGRLQAIDNVYLLPDGDVVVIPTARFADARQFSIIA